jgi:hypothetical protein
MLIDKIIKYAIPSCIVVLLLLESCNPRASKNIPQKNTSTRTHINFPSYIRSQSLITTDNKEHFFSRLANLDMSIQLKDNNGNSPKNKTLKAYKNLLRSEVLPPTDIEKEKVKTSFDTIANYLDKLNISTNIDTIHIIKISGAAYGSEAFYTRENCIMIPEAQFGMSSKGFTDVMLHELFHIVSRYDEEIKDKAYDLIGFHKINAYQVRNINLQKQILLNPDGLSNNYAISLTDPAGKTLEAVPVIYSKQTRYQQFVPDFFNYIQFDLFAIEDSKSTSPYIKEKPIQITSIDKSYYSDFFRQISDNTQYIIHPDEIMADNFMLMINAYINNNFEDFSTEGRAILDKLHKIFTS